MGTILPEENSLNNSSVNKDRERILVQTGDGSFTFLVPGVDETYHSRHGAKQESLHVFIKNGLHAVEQEEVTVLEVGMGTGLNAYLTAGHKRGVVRYVALEPFPLEEEAVSALVNSVEEGKEFLDALHALPFEEEKEMEPNFFVVKHRIGLEEYIGGKGIDVIYYDAFGPRVEPLLWTLERMQQCYNLLNPGGIFVTYCAKGEVRRNLVAAGFVVERLAGPPGKREMLRGVKPR